MYCYGHNFVIIGSILEILDVLSSPNRVASNFGTLCDNGRLLGDDCRRFRDSDQSLNPDTIPDIFSVQGLVDIPKSSAVIPQQSAVIAQSTKIRNYSIRAAQNIQIFKNRPNNHKVMSITVPLKKRTFFTSRISENPGFS